MQTFSYTKKGPGRRHRQGGAAAKRYAALNLVREAIQQASTEYVAITVAGRRVAVGSRDRASVRNGILTIKSHWGHLVAQVAV